MSRRVILPALAAATLLAGGGCYQDETTTPAPSRKPLARVLLTDAPFPYDSVASVNVYVVSIDASSGLDTSGGGDWVRVASPEKTFDLLTLQHGTTAFLGEGELDARQYRAIRMVIDADKSSIVYNNGAPPPVHWPWPGSGAITMYALVEEPLDFSAPAIAASGEAVIVIDFDVGRSFLYDYFGTKEFTVLPWLRAVNSAATGALEGTVTADSGGQSRPIKNANVTLYSGDPRQPPSTWYAAATGRSDDTGYYKVAFVSAATYIVRIEQPDYPSLGAVVTPNVQVSAGATTRLSVSLPAAGGSTGGAYVHVSGPSSVGVGGTITLYAAVGDANGNLVPNPSVTWTSSAPSIADVTGVGDTASVAGRQPGLATITATSGGLSDTLTVQVVGSPAPVASVTVVPGSVTAAVGDSLGFRAELRDSAGTVLTNRPVSWFSTDTAVFIIEGAFGPYSIVRCRKVGSALLRATSEGKTGQTSITVH
ncbi:MAG: hypothetical protein DMD55_03290 [Gemmatimonadetes bacterium]|nr:MAG: hypothetical protein DMD55_03290 [Gemmatimonadota bacterium]